MGPALSFHAFGGEIDTAVLMEESTPTRTPVGARSNRAEIDNRTSLRLPFNIRLLMAAWNLLFLKTSGSSPTRQRARREPGRYRVRGLTHCGTCHTPRNPLVSEEASHAVAAADLGTGHAPNITADPKSGRRLERAQELADCLRRGRARSKAQAAGPTRGRSSPRDGPRAISARSAGATAPAGIGRDVRRAALRCPLRNGAMGPSGQGSADGSSPSLVYNTGAEGDLWRERERVLGRTAWKPSRSSCSCCSR